MSASLEVTMPESASEAVRVFDENPGVTVIAGATIVLPELTAEQRRAGPVMLLSAAGMDHVSCSGGVWRIGATATLEALAKTPDPLSSAAATVGDPEVRRKATIGGNLCAPPDPAAPRGDLQGPLVALGARIRWSANGSEHVAGVEEFLASSAANRLVLEIEFPTPRGGAFAALQRPHSHGYTALAVACADFGGEHRFAVTGLAPTALRLRSADDPTPIGGSPITPLHDALASSWYRQEMVPVLVHRCIAQLGGGA
jgi:CO/xanthine dehydrogenase FAD-binding subunit